MEYLQLHYYLIEDFHSMDAFIKNKAESEILKLFKEITELLEIEDEISFETVALEEGGIKAFYKLKKKTRNRIKQVAIFLGGILSVIISDVVSDKLKVDSEYEDLKKEELILNIKKLKRDLETEETSENQKTLIIENLSIYLSETNKIKIFKSNFYSTLLKEPKIEKVSTQFLDSEKKPITIEKIVPRDDFHKFIIHNIDVEPNYNPEKLVEIVSPVLKKGNLKWKGIYDEKPVNFNLKDNEFLHSVISGQVSFSSGTTIKCDIEFEQTMNDDGEIAVSGINVYNVTDIIETNKITETKRKKRNIELRNQTKLDF